MQHQLTAVLAATVVLAAPTAGQETQADTLYRSAGMPVWVMVMDEPEKAGVHRVLVAVVWDDEQSGLRFAHDVAPGEIVVTLPTVEDPDKVDLSEGCRFTSPGMDHGTELFLLAKRTDPDCLAPRADSLSVVAVEHLGALMACEVAKRDDDTKDPAIRYFGCHWAAKPESG